VSVHFYLLAENSPLIATYFQRVDIVSMDWLLRWYPLLSSWRRRRHPDCIDGDRQSTGSCIARSRRKQPCAQTEYRSLEAVYTEVEVDHEGPKAGRASGVGSLCCRRLEGWRGRATRTIRSIVIKPLRSTSSFQATCNVAVLLNS
jgi:hypothetical protein